MQSAINKLKTFLSGDLKDTTLISASESAEPLELSSGTPHQVIGAESSLEFPAQNQDQLIDKLRSFLFKKPAPTIFIQYRNGNGGVVGICGVIKSINYGSSTLEIQNKKVFEEPVLTIKFSQVVSCLEDKSN